MRAQQYVRGPLRLYELHVYVEPRQSMDPVVMLNREGLHGPGEPNRDDLLDSEMKT